MEKIDFLKAHQKYCNYQITSAIQLLDFAIDIERLRKEIFEFIVRNHFGFSVVSLRLPKGETNWTTDYEMLESNAVNDFMRKDFKQLINPILHYRDERGKPMYNHKTAQDYVKQRLLKYKK